MDDEAAFVDSKGFAKVDLDGLLGKIADLEEEEAENDLCEGGAFSSLASASFL